MKISISTIIIFLIPFPIFGAIAFDDSISFQLLPFLILFYVSTKVLISYKISCSSIIIIPISLILIKFLSDLVRFSLSSHIIYLKLIFLLLIVVFFDYCSKDGWRKVKYFYVAIYFSVIYSCYQFFIAYIGLDYKIFIAEFMVSVWNINAWHVIIIRDGFIRVPGFAFEPAYQTIFVATALMVFIFKNGVSNIKYIILILLGLILSYSRNGLIFLLFLAIFLLFKWINIRLLMILPFVSLLAPALGTIFFDIDGGDYDVSVIARLLPLRLFLSSGWFDLFFGIQNYENWMYLAWPAYLDSVFISEKINLDPKSLVGFILINFGFIGLILYAGAISYVFRKSKKALIFVSAYNVVSFNIGGIFFLTQWLLYSVLYHEINVRYENKFSV